MSDLEKKGERFSRNEDLTLSAGAFAALLCVMFGANAAAVKFSLAGLGPFTALAIRFAMASCAIALWAKASGRSFRLKRGQGGRIFVLTSFFVVQLSLFYLGLSRTYASRGALIVNLLPFFVLILAHFFLPGDRITLKKSVGMILGFSGVAVLFANQGGESGGFRSGDLIVLAATTIWSCNTIYVKRIIHDFQPFHIVLYSMLFATPIFFAGGCLWDKPMAGNVDWGVVAAMAYQGLATASFGFVAWNTMLRRYGATSLHAFVFIMPVSGVIFGAVLLGEPVTSNLLLALVLVTMGILTVHLKNEALG